jgi:hypothetical protein
MLGEKLVWGFMWGKSSADEKDEKIDGADECAIE